MTHKDQHTLWMASSSWRSAKLHAGRMCRIDDFEKEFVVVGVCKKSIFSGYSIKMNKLNFPFVQYL
uniref:Uncharacterized protein n=1 Tax=Anguilla anguilla TaxID=7936 RepID=A0A0E9PRS8_ANGAN